MDSSRRYYHAERGREKRYIGSGDVFRKDNECRMEIEHLTEHTLENARQKEEEKGKRRLQTLLQKHYRSYKI